MNFFLKLSEKRLDKLSAIVSDIALVSLDSVVLPAILDKFNPLLILLGSAATIFLQNDKYN